MGGQDSDRQYSIEDFIHIVETLRSENGCPWDRKQTHESLKPCMMEEAAELVSSIRIYDKTGNAENMREELGDILLQVVMHAQIAKEEKLFTWEDVVNEISTKMIRRHPHVFADHESGTDKSENLVEVKNENDVLTNWDEIKRREKAGKTWIESPLREIPGELPSLTRASKILKKADKLYHIGGDYWANVKSLQEAAEELKGLQPEKEDEKLAQIIGNMLMTLSDISRRYRIAQEQILTDKIEDLIERYEPMPKLEK